MIVGEQVRFQNVQAVELGEKIGSRVRHVAHRIFRVRLLISAESRVSASEVEVVHLLITPVEVSRRQHGVSGVGRETRADQREQGDGGLRPSQNLWKRDQNLAILYMCWIRQTARRCQNVVNNDLTLWRTARENAGPPQHPRKKGLDPALTLAASGPSNLKVVSHSGLGHASLR